MGGADGGSQNSDGRAPEDWETEAGRTYARLQADFAEQCDVAVTSRVAETEMGRVHYLEAGSPDGQPVVLLHGIGTTAAMWLPLLGDLLDDYRYLVPDRPGQALSEPVTYGERPLREELVGYLSDLYDAWGVERAHVVGNSLGGLQAFLLTIDHDAVDRLCLVGAPGGLSREMPLSMRLLTVRGVNRLLFWLQRRGDPVETARDQTREMVVSDASAVPETFYELFGAVRQLPDRAASLRSLVEHEGSWGKMDPLFDIREEVVAIERPTRFLWGTEDWFWGPEEGRPVVEEMPEAHLQILEGHGHMPWLEPGDEVEMGIRTFLAE